MGAYEDRQKEGHTPVTLYAQTATTTDTTIAPKQGVVAQEITSFKVLNRNTSRNLQISVDGGTNYLAVVPLQEIEQFIDSIHELKIKSASSTVTYDLYYTVRP